ILQGEAESISRAEAAMLSVMRGYGFERVVTPLIEYVDVLSLGLGSELKNKVLKFIDPTTGDVMAIRPDITPQVARMAATRLKGAELPLRLCYNESVLRYAEEGPGKSTEILQTGAEYISKTATVDIDAMMIIMAIESLIEAGVRNFKLDIGDVSFVKSILQSLSLDEDERRSIKKLLIKKDNSGLKEVLGSFGDKVNEKECSLVTKLTDLYGDNKDVLKKGRSLLEGIGGDVLTATKSLDYIEEVTTIVSDKGYNDHITIDLGEVRGFDYYTGIIFEGFSTNLSEAIVGGGRYDNLMENYGLKAASTGFAFNTGAVVKAIGKRP
ncbi:MAG: ATP phosphoribosyltransferase regulatory subunit, partial [Deltaproteobacteria bacterium]|nr:ATP phosphoribosyltransferase regulatory subunit [Deltaproteobacteria bacterium]